MWIYIIILGAIWVGLLIPVVQQRLAWIACAHGGTGLFFTSLLLSLGLRQTGDIADNLWLEIIGFVLFIPAAILITSAMVAITQGNLVKNGMMRIVRHPMYLGNSYRGICSHFGLPIYPFRSPVYHSNSAPVDGIQNGGRL